jgi:Catalytic LigB subunit of aromatic ring-opening dioxygenase
MAQIVLGLATSHGPMLVTDPPDWALRVPDDRRNLHHYRRRQWTFDELVRERRGEVESQITPEVMQQRHAACQDAIEKLADVFAEAQADIAVIVGNDQMEIFSEALLPAFSVFWGDRITNFEFTQSRLDALPAGIAISIPGYIPPSGATYAGEPKLARHIIETAVADGFDVASMKRLPREETPHAFGFVYRRIMRDAPVPSVPVLINTFYPPNQPTVRRCYDFGKSILRAIQSWPAEARVALIATGGLTHFVIDESVDAIFLQALRDRSIEAVVELGEAIFQDGTSEMKNWIPVAGAMAALGLPPTVVDYVPCYRSEAGTGNAMSFVYWR